MQPPRQTTADPVPSLAAALACTLTALLLFFGGAAAASQIPPLDVLQDESRLCAEPIAQAERTHGMPGQLMAAIAVAESGRWTADRRAVFAWPWTVTSGAESWLLASKAEAVAQVKRLQARGVTNIDVGCMQINLRWHGSAFDAVEDALDPDTNVAYAATLLARLFEERRSWPIAVGLYHSATPALQRRYKNKVMALWEFKRRRAAESPIARAENGSEGSGAAEGGLRSVQDAGTPEPPPRLPPIELPTEVAASDGDGAPAPATAEP